jgi:hypothetical protein
MKKRIIFIACIFIWTIFQSNDALAITPTKSNTTDPTSPLYYNNDIPNNAAVSANKEAAKFANNPLNKGVVDAIITANGGQCGIECAAELGRAAANDTVDAVIWDAAWKSTDQTSISEWDPVATPTTTEVAGKTKSSWGPDDMTSTDFRLDPSFLTPSEKIYKKGTIGNIKDILANIGKYLLIATTTIAVLSIVVGGLMISTTWPTDRAAKGKTIIMLNIMAVIVALFSYSIIKLVSWIIA